MFAGSKPVNKLEDNNLNRRISFIAEWFQEEAAIVRTFTICYFFADNAIEVYDKHKKIFLRRTKVVDLTERDFFLGSKINIFGRQFDLVAYADEYTKATLAKNRQTAFILVKHTVMKKLGDILTAFVQSEFSISRGIMAIFTAEQVNAFLGAKSKAQSDTSVLMNELISDSSVGFEMVSPNAFEKLINCYSQSTDETAMKLMPGKLRELFANDEIRAGVYCSQTEEKAAKDIEFFFGKEQHLQVDCTMKNSTLAIIKPHCIKEGNVGKVIHDILHNGFKITALQTHMMERANCEEFYEVYRGVLPEYISMVTQLAGGVCLALEIQCEDPQKNSYEEFRNYCGPLDPEIAKLLRPQTLRSRYGTTKTLNAIHCTDLPDDTYVELQYLFKILN